MTPRKHKRKDETEPDENEEEEGSEDIYDEEKREEMLEDDEITVAEEGFMRGWEGDVEGGKKHRKDGDHQDEASVELAKEQ